MVFEDFRGNQREVRWGEQRALANRAANVLAAHGVQREDRVAICAPASPETAAFFLGTWKNGAILLSLSVLYGDEGIRHRLRDSEPRVLVTDSENVGRMPTDLVDDVLVLDDELLAGADDRFDTADTAAPTIRHSSITRRGPPGSRRASSTPTATSSATRSSRTATR